MNAIHGQGKAAFKGGEQASLKAAAAEQGAETGESGWITTISKSFSVLMRVHRISYKALGSSLPQTIPPCGNTPPSSSCNCDSSYETIPQLN
jgi:hypothetical protein